MRCSIMIQLLFPSVPIGSHVLAFGRLLAQDAARPLSHDPRVLETLGPNGQAFNVLIDAHQSGVSRCGEPVEFAWMCFQNKRL